MEAKDLDYVVRGQCETLEGVRKFHEAFDCHTSPGPFIPELTTEQHCELELITLAMEHLARHCLKMAAKARGTPGALIFTRLQLTQEELGEFARALLEHNIVEVLDALTDIQYVNDGAYLAFGLGELKLRAFREVQRSNMTKLGADGKPTINEAGRVVKGPNYEKPRLKDLMFKFLYGG